MKRLLLFVVLAVLALPASAHASTFAAEFGSPFADAARPVRRHDERLQRRRADRRRRRQRQSSDRDVEQHLDLPAPGGWRVRRRGRVARRASERAELRRVRGLRRRRPARPGGRDVRPARSSRSSCATRPTTASRRRASYSIPAGGSSIQTATSTATGALDLVFGSWNSASVHVLTRSGTGFRLRSQRTRSARIRARSPLATTTGIGRPDLAVANCERQQRVDPAAQCGQARRSHRRAHDPRRDSAAAASALETSTVTDASTSPSPTQSDDTAQVLLRNAANDGFTDDGTGRRARSADRPGGRRTSTATARLTLAVDELDRRRASRVLSGGTTPEPSISIASAYGVAVADFDGDQRVRPRGHVGDDRDRQLHLAAEHDAGAAAAAAGADHRRRPPLRRRSCRSPSPGAT